MKCFLHLVRSFLPLDKGARPSPSLVQTVHEYVFYVLWRNSTKIQYSFLSISWNKE